MDISLSKQDLVTGELQLGKRPAVIVVDISNGFALPQSPLGGDFQPEIEANISLLKAAQKQQIPVFFTTVVYDNDAQASVFRQRIPALNTLQRGSTWIDIHNDLRDYVLPNRIIEKHHPSAFFGTNLYEQLQQLNIDSLIITGLTTSGCVRATCVDGLQYNFICTVVTEACGDRNEEAHKMSLHDMHAKYASVKSLAQTLAWLQSL